MDIAFQDETLRKICLKRAKAVSVFGPDVANEMMKRVADIRAAEAVTDLLVGVRHSDAFESEILYIDLSKGYRLVFEPNHIVNPKSESGRIIWEQVTRLRVIDILRSIEP